MREGGREGRLEKEDLALPQLKKLSMQFLGIQTKLGSQPRKSTQVGRGEEVKLQSNT